MYFTKKKLGVNVTVPMKCASLYCVVQLSANGNRKHFQSQYLIFFFMKRTQQQYYCNLPPMVWYVKFIADFQSNRKLRTSNELTFQNNFIITNLIFFSLQPN